MKSLQPLADVVRINAQPEGEHKDQVEQVEVCAINVRNYVHFRILLFKLFWLVRSVKNKELNKKERE